MDDLAGVVDRPEDWPVLDRQVKATGRVQDFVEDRVLTPSGEQIVRQWVEHPGAVAVMAMDAGLIGPEEDVITVGGKAKGADTAVLLTPAHSQYFFDTDVKEILCMPRGHKNKHKTQ